MPNRGPTAEEIAERVVRASEAAMMASSLVGDNRRILVGTLTAVLKEAIAGAKPEWKTIDSAPKDGTRIVAIALDEMGQRHDSADYTPYVAWWSPKSERWVRQVQGWGHAAASYIAGPTHWLVAIPASPETPNLPPEHQDEGK